MSLAPLAPWIDSPVPTGSASQPQVYVATLPAGSIHSPPRDSSVTLTDLAVHLVRARGSIVSQLLPAAFDRYLRGLPDMSLTPVAPLCLSCFPQRSIAGPRGPAAAGSLTPVVLWRNAERGWKAERLKSESR